MQSEHFLRHDAYGSPIQLRLPGGEANYRTCCGSLMNICATIASLSYFTMLMKVMFTNSNSQLTFSVLSGYFPPTQPVKQSDGFQVAFGYLLGNGSEDEQELLRFVARMDKTDPTIEDSQDPIDLEPHDCTQEELDSFFTIQASQKEDYELYIKNNAKLFCIDNSKLELFGNFSSQKSNLLKLFVDIEPSLCSGKKAGVEDPSELELELDNAFEPSVLYCAGTRQDEERMNRSIFMLSNQQRFDTKNFSDVPVVKESVLTWFDFPVVPTKHTMQIQRTVLERDDNLMMSIPDVTGTQEITIDMVEKKTEPMSIYVPLFYTRMQIMFEVASDANLVQRSAYTFWTVLGDVGGLNGIIFSLAAAIVSVFAYNKDENYLASELFSHSRDKGGQREQPQKLDAGSQSALSDYLKDNLPSVCLSLCCLRRSRRDEIFERARGHFVEEMDVVYLLRQIRFLNFAAKALLTEQQESEMKKKARKTVMSDSNEELSYSLDEEPEPGVVAINKNQLSQRAAGAAPTRDSITLRSFSAIQMQQDQEAPFANIEMVNVQRRRATAAALNESTTKRMLADNTFVEVKSRR